MRFGCVVLTTGDRPQEVTAAIESVRKQRDVDVEVVVVWNTDDAVDRDVLPPGITVVSPGRNLGIPAGRNLGVDHLVDCDLVLFLDDDGMLIGDNVLATARDRFAEDVRLGALSLRIVDPVTGLTQRRHVPRLRVGDPSRGSWVTTFLGGAVVIRVSAFAAAGGLPGEFFYAHEETSLAWRLLDHGYRIWYAGDLRLAHPAIPPSRHGDYQRLTARNRVLLARKHLPAVVGALYLGLWFLLGLLRNWGGRRALVAGFREGIAMPEVDRAPIRWRTVLLMARYGRPPLL